MRLWLVILLSPLLVACAPEREAGELLHAMVTTPHWITNSTVSDIRGLTCGKSQLKLNGGTARGSNGRGTSQRAIFHWEVELYFPLDVGETEPKKFECSVDLESGFSPIDDKNFRLPGPLRIASCENFKCTLKKMPVDCDKLQKVLSEVCN